MKKYTKHRMTAKIISKKNYTKTNYRMMCLYRQHGCQFSRKFIL